MKESVHLFTHSPSLLAHYERITEMSFTSVIRLSPEKATTEGESVGLAVLGEAGRSPAEKTSPCCDGKDCDRSVIQ